MSEIPSKNVHSQTVPILYHHYFIHITFTFLMFDVFFRCFFELQAYTLRVYLFQQQQKMQSTHKTLFYCKESLSYSSLLLPPVSHPLFVRDLYTSRSYEELLFFAPCSRASMKSARLVFVVRSLFTHCLSSLFSFLSLFLFTWFEV